MNRKRLTISISNRYQKHLRKREIKRKMIYPKTSEVDVLNLSYFRKFMEDYIYTWNFINYDEIQRCIDLDVNDYNTIRAHSPFNYLTPEISESATLNEDFRKEWT
jgi:hypothetical protein